MKYTYPDLFHAKRVDVEVRSRFDDEQELQSGVEDELTQREAEPQPEVAEDTVLAVQSEVSEGWQPAQNSRPQDHDGRHYRFLGDLWAQCLQFS